MMLRDLGTAFSAAMGIVLVGWLASTYYVSRECDLEAEQWDLST